MTFLKEAFFYHIYTSKIHIRKYTIQLVNIQTTKTHIQPYLRNIHSWDKSNNYNKTTCTLIIPDLEDYNTRLNLQISNTILDIHTTE